MSLPCDPSYAAEEAGSGIRGAHTAGLPERLYSRQGVGRVGGGIEIRPTERTSLRLQGAYLMPSLQSVERSTTAGLQLEIRF